MCASQTTASAVLAPSRARASRDCATGSRRRAARSTSSASSAAGRTSTPPSRCAPSVSPASFSLSLGAARLHLAHLDDLQPGLVDPLQDAVQGGLILDVAAQDGLDRLDLCVEARKAAEQRLTQPALDP